MRDVPQERRRQLVLDELVQLHGPHTGTWRTQTRTGKPTPMPVAALVRTGCPDLRGQPNAAYYDPYIAYYPSPLAFVAETMMWSAMFSMMMPPHFTVVDHHNHVQGFADEPGIQNGPTASAEPAADAGGNWYDGDGSTDTATEGGDLGGDVGGGDSWWGGDGGDGGGFDGGGLFD